MMGRTDYVVAVLIANQKRERTLALIVDGSQCRDDLLSLVGRAELYALFDDITGELMPGEIHKLRCHKRDDLRAVLFSAVLDDMLRNIITELVHNE